MISRDDAFLIRNYGNLLNSLSVVLACCSGRLLNRVNYPSSRSTSLDGSWSTYHLESYISRPIRYTVVF